MLMHALKTVMRVMLLSTTLHGMHQASLAATAEGKQNSVQAAKSEQPEPILVEVFFNKQSAGDYICYKTEEDYWIPFEAFTKATNITREAHPSDGQIAYPTNIGVLKHNPADQITIEQTSCISFSQLKKDFFVSARFVQSVFAIAVDVPWVPGTPSKTRPAAPSITPDIHAPSSSLSFLRLEPDISYEFQDEYSKNLLFEAGGRIAGGVWDITWEGDPETAFPATKYHWTTYNDRIALRIGTGSTDLYSLAGDIDFTGLQLGWNNHGILKQLDFERYSDSDAFLSLDREQQRTIEGNGPPASIAELRIDNLVVARQRIGLNGRFIFQNVRMTSDLRKTEVYLYERSIRQKPLAVLDFSMSVVNRSLPAHEILVRTGLGIDKNPLNSDDTDPASLTGFGQIIYGLNNRMSIETGIQHNPETESADAYAGAVLSIFDNWIAAVYGALSNRNYGADFRVEGKGRQWSFSYLGRYNDNGFGSDGEVWERTHTGRFSTSIFHPLDILLYAKRERKANTPVNEYILPGLYVYVHPRLMLSAVPNDEEIYHYEANMYFSSAGDLTLAYENKVVSADIGYEFSPSLSSRAISTYAINSGNSVNSLYFDWKPGANRYNLIRMGVSRAETGTGYTLAWNKFINAGMQMSLQYSYNMNNALQLETEENFSNLVVPEARQYIALTVTCDLGRSNKKFYPINRSAISHTRGGLAGSLSISNTTSVSSSDINDVDILINRRKLGQRQVDGSFFVGNLKPGVYAVEVDDENLPLELNVQQKKVYAEVLNGSVTEVIIPVVAEYSISGKISGPDKKGIENITVTVTDAKGETASKSKTNLFGYYRADTLPSGSYTVRAEGKETTVTIDDDYVYNVDLTIDPTSIIAPAAKIPSQQTEESLTEKPLNP